MHKSPFGPKSIANKVWLASVSPFAGALLAFSFVMVAFGSTVYVASIPSLLYSDLPGVSDAAQTGYANTKYSLNYGEDTVGIGYVDPEEEGPGAQSAGVTSSRQSTPMLISSSAGTLSSPVPIMNLIKQVQDEMLNKPGSSADNTANDPSNSVGTNPNPGPSNTTNPGGTTNTPVEPDQPTTPEEPDDSPPSAEEAKLHNALASYYALLPGLYENVVSAFNTFSADHDNPDLAVRRQHYLYVMRTLRNAPAGEWNKIFLNFETGDELRPAENSKYYDKYQEIIHLRSDLTAASGHLMQAWSANCQGASFDEYMGILHSYSENGQDKNLLDFVNRYPGAAV